MRVMTAVAGIRPGFNVFVNFDEINTRDNVTVRAEPTSFFGEHPLFVGTMGLMTLQTVFDCGFVDYSSTPILCNFTMATETHYRLPFFEDVIMGGAMGCVTGDAVFIDSRFMGELGVLNGLVYVLVAFKAEFSWFFLYDKGKVCRMWGVTTITFTFSYGDVCLDGVTGILDGLVASCTKVSIFGVCLEIGVLAGAMELVASGAVCSGKGLMEAEATSFIGLFFMTREAERTLGTG